MKEKIKDIIFFIIFIILISCVFEIVNNNMDKKFDNTCADSFSNKIKKIKRSNGFLIVTLIDEQNLYFSFQKNDDIDTFLNIVKIGNYIEKEANSFNLKTSTDSTLKDNVRQWIIRCH